MKARECRTCMYWKRDVILPGTIDEETILYCTNKKSYHCGEETDSDDDCEEWEEHE